MTNVRLSLPTVIAIVLIVGAGAFAAGRSTSTTASTSTTTTSTAPAVQEMPAAQLGPTSDLPPGHPPIDNGAGMPAPIGTGAPAAESSLTWKLPPRWKEAPNTSSMRIATYKIPGPGGDAEVSVAQAGGSVAANAQRWIGQFDAASQKSAKQSTKKVAGFDVTIVEVQGTYSGGMGGDGGANMALLGAIVANENTSMPYFFKVTGPASTVTAARAELDQLLSSLTDKR